MKRALCLILCVSIFCVLPVYGNTAKANAYFKEVIAMIKGVIEVYQAFTAEFNAAQDDEEFTAINERLEAFADELQEKMLAVIEKYIGVDTDAADASVMAELTQVTEKLGIAIDALMEAAYAASGLDDLDE
jgi:septum formation topological specificity factor MinE